MVGHLFVTEAGLKCVAQRVCCMLEGDDQFMRSKLQSTVAECPSMSLCDVANGLCYFMV